MRAAFRPVLVPSRPRGVRLVALVVSAGMLIATPVTPVAARDPEQANDHSFLHAKQAPGGIVALSTPIAGFSDTVAISGLLNPTAIRFASDGRVVVAQKSGRVLIYPSLGSSSPILAADLSTKVHDFWDRGLLGMALDPGFATNGNLYLLYTYDHILGAAAGPRWGDTCPSPPGPTTDGCVVSARLSRFTLTNNVAGAEQPLIEDWCQQFPSHSIGSLAFGADGFLYASSGDGASFNAADWGQFGGSVGSPTLVNPCGDPPGSNGASNTSPSGRGGALRSQSLRRPAGEPVTLDGTIIRIDAATGSAAPTNPLAGSANPNAARIVAHGLRNPFRLTFRPGTNDLWIGDVGWGTWEEINRLSVPTTSPVRNFGWPCYEGSGQQSGYSALTQCTNLYADGANPAQAPVYAWNHGSAVVAGDGCPTTVGSAITGLAFYQGGSYPSKYTGALFFADHSRNCIWAMLPTNGIPDPAKRELLVAAAGHPVDLQIGPNGDLFYVDLEGGTVHRMTYTSSNTPPSAVATANPTNGLAPLDVAFDGRGSSDADGDALTFAWDFTDDGTTDATTATAAFRYITPGVHVARLTVRDARGASSLTTVTITANNSAPVVSISAPTTALRWSVGEAITYAGSATDPQDGTIPASGLTWTFTMFHCTTPSMCHSHLIETRPGDDSRPFVAPEHEYPSYLEVALTARDSGGLTTTSAIRIDPRTVDLTFTTTPNRLPLVINGASTQGTTAAPTITKTVIVNSQNSVSAAPPPVLNGIEYTFSSWSDGSTSAARTIVAPATWGSALGATFVPSSADLSVTQAGLLAANGSSLTWTLTAANAAGGMNASGVTVTDTLSGNLGAPAFDAPGWSCSYVVSTRIATCVLSSLAVGVASQIRITSPVTGRKANKAENTVQVSSQTRDVTTTNNAATGSVRLR